MRVVNLFIVIFTTVSTRAFRPHSQETLTDLSELQPRELLIIALYVPF